MRTLIISLALATAAATAATLTAASPATSQPPARTTLTFFDPDKGGFQKFITADNDGFQRLAKRPPDRPRPGDSSVTTDRFLDPETCARAARNVARLLVIRPLKGGDAMTLTDGALLLNDGKLAFRFAGTFSENPAAIAIVGGTGAYRDVRGEITFSGQAVNRCDTRGSLVVADFSLE